MKKSFKRILSSALAITMSLSMFSTNTMMTASAETNESSKLEWSSVWTGGEDTSWYDEDLNEFEIDTAEKLAGLAALVNDGEDFDNKKVSLTKSILLNEVKSDTADLWYSGNEVPANLWTQIGKSGTKTFEGIFDAGIYDENDRLIGSNVVKGLYIDETGDNAGLFGYIEDGTVQNLVIDTSYVKGLNNVGTIVGTIYGVATIDNCKTKNAYVNGAKYVGGIAGFLNRSNVLLYSGTLSNCENNAKVFSSNIYTGGLVGLQQRDWVISNSVNNGEVFSTFDIDAECYVGGIVGYNYGAIRSCVNNGQVSANTKEVGGIAGRNDNYSSKEGSDKFLVENGLVSQCVNRGKVIVVNTNDVDDIGGIAGENNLGKVIECANSGEVVVSNKAENVGGVVGYNYGAEVLYSYNVGTVTAKNALNVGGVVGRNYKLDAGTTAKTIGCYSSAAVFGGSEVGAVVGLNSVATVSECFFNSDLTTLKGVGKSTNSLINSSINDVKSLEDADLKETLPNKTYYRYNNSERYNNGYPLLKSEAQIYVVTFVMDENNKVEVLSKENGTVSFDQVPVNEGKLFMGWYDGIKRLVPNEDENSNASISCDMVVEPKWFEMSNELSVVTKDKVNYYSIKTYEDLCWFRDFINSGKSANAILESDIFINNKAGYENWSKKAPSFEWISIGGTDVPFKGIFEGNGHSIFGLYQNDENADNIGLFGCVDGAKIQNLTIESVYVKGSENVAALVGEIVFSKDATVIENCNLINGNVKGIDNVASYAGICVNSTITNCKNNLNVEVVKNEKVQDIDHEYIAGGIVATSTGIVVDSVENDGKVVNNAIGSRVVGGIVGKTCCTDETKFSSIVTNAANYGDISVVANATPLQSTTTVIGGVVGFNGNEIHKNDKDHTYTVANTLNVGEIKVLEPEVEDDEEEIDPEAYDNAIVGEIVGINTFNGKDTTKVEVENSYYLERNEEVVYDAIGDNVKGTVDEETSSVTEEMLLSGEVAKLLGESFGQTLKSSNDVYDKYPRLLNETNKIYELKLYLSYTETNPEVVYANKNITADRVPSGSDLKKYNTRIFLGWSTSPKNAEYIPYKDFVKGDMSLYAQFYTIATVAADKNDKSLSSGNKMGFEMAGVQVNVKTGSEALRFCTRISDALIQKLGGSINKANGELTGVKVGYLLCDTKKLEKSKVEELRVDTVINENKKNIVKNIEVTEATKMYGKYNVFTGETGKIALENYDNEISVRTYITYTDLSGAERQFYFSEESSDSVAYTYSISLYDAAKAFNLPETNKIVRAYDNFKK